MEQGSILEISGARVKVTQKDTITKKRGRVSKRTLVRLELNVGDFIELIQPPTHYLLKNKIGSLSLLMSLYLNHRNRSGNCLRRGPYFINFLFGGGRGRGWGEIKITLYNNSR